MSNVFLRSANADDQPTFLALAHSSRALHGSWTSAPSTSVQFQNYLEQMVKPENAGFLVCERASGDMIGVVNITNIVRGAFESGYLGYYAFAGYERRGFMREGLSAVVCHAFSTLNLHRLEANIQPGNAASIALVKGCGFSLEGYSPRYLRIAGEWRDHERWALVAGQSHSPIAT